MNNAEQARIAELKQKPVSELSYADREEILKYEVKSKKWLVLKILLGIFIGIPVLVYVVLLIIVRLI